MKSGNKKAEKTSRMPQRRYEEEEETTKSTISPDLVNRATSDSLEPSSITILSWNISNCQPSHEAPVNFFTNRNKCEAEIVREIMKHKADVLCLQECPEANWKPTLLARFYTLVGSEISHCNYTQLWVRNNMFFQRITKCDAPSVAAVALVDEYVIGLSSSHLIPEKKNSLIRFEQIKSLKNCFPCGMAFLIGGDFNMRKSEDKPVEERLGLVDAWKAGESRQNHMYTWNSFSNQYHGPEAFKFRCRFDRIFINKGSNTSRPPNPTMAKVDFKLVANKPLIMREGGKCYKFYLSDHYGILSTVH